MLLRRFGILLSLVLVSVSTSLPATPPIAHEGTVADLWDCKRSPVLEQRLGIDDSGHGYLTCWLWVDGNYRNQTIELKYGGTENYHGSIHLSWIGWKRVVVPLDAIESDAQVASDLKGKVQMSIRGNPPDDLKIAYTPMTYSREVTGPGLSDGDLLDQLDLAQPGLREVKTCLVQGNQSGALHALAEYFRKSRLSAATFEPTTDVKRTETDADRLGSGELSIVGINYKYSGGKIIWNYNPSDGRPDMTAEWVFYLNRLFIWKPLAQAYIATQNEKYAQTLIGQMRSWVNTMSAPAVDDEKPNSGWRGLEVGLRMSDYWNPAWNTILRSPSMSDQDVILTLKSIWEQATFLNGHPFGPGNHFLLAMAGLSTSGALYPEFREAAHWRERARDELNHALKVGVLSEGAWYELSPSYHQWVTAKMIALAELLKKCGYVDDIPATDMLQKMAEWNVRLCAPDLTVPRLNDGHGTTLKDVCQPDYINLFPSSQLLKWGLDIQSNPAATPPSFTSEALPDSGYTVMRTGWNKEASYLLLDVGPLGGWHGHQDALNLVSWFYGRLFLFDNGGYKYDASAWRTYGRGSASHNTILVDELGQQRGFSEADPGGSNPPNTPVPTFSSSPAADYASGWFVGNYGTDVDHARPLATQHREVVFIKPNVARQTLAVVLDRMSTTTQSAHLYDLRWQILSTKWKTSSAQHCTWTVDVGQPNLAVLSLSGATEFHADSGVKKPELLGWNFPTQNDAPVPALTLRHMARGKDVSFLTVLIPFQGIDDPVSSVKQNSSTSWTVQLANQPPLTINIANVAPTGRSLQISD